MFQRVGQVLHIRCGLHRADRYAGNGLFHKTAEGFARADLHDGVHAHVGHLPDGVLHEHAALHLLHQQLLDGGAVILHIPQAVEDHGDLGIRKRHALEVFPQGIPGRGHQGGVEGAADLQGQAPAGALLLGNGGGLLHSGLLTADAQLAGTVVVGAYHAPPVSGRVAGLLQGAAVQVQNLSPAEKEVPPLKKLWTSPFVLFLREAIMLYFSRRVPQAAACLAYFVLLTVFPVLICVSYILGMVNIDIVSLMDQLQPLLPEAALDVLESYLRYISFHQTPGLFLAGLAGCWFSAAAAFRTITRVIIDMYEDVSQSMVRGMVASILFPLGLLVTVDLSVIVVVTGQRTLAAVAQRFPFWDHVLNLWSWTRYVLLFSIFFLFILAVLNMAAPFGTPRLPVLLSSLVSALALVVSSAVFSWFISMSSRYSLVYGSLVSLIILLIWLYLCGQILFIGIVFTSVWYKHWRRRRLTDPDD